MSNCSVSVDSDDREMICEDVLETSPPNSGIDASSGPSGLSSGTETTSQSLLPKPGTRSLIWHYFGLRGGKAVDNSFSASHIPKMERTNRLCDTLHS